MMRDWMADAACRDADPDLFFIEDRHYNEALAICATCPVIEDCLRYAIVGGIGYGVWGGTTPNGRGFGRRQGWGRETVICSCGRLGACPDGKCDRHSVFV